MSAIAYRNHSRVHAAAVTHAPNAARHNSTPKLNGESARSSGDHSAYTSCDSVSAISIALKVSASFRASWAIQAPGCARMNANARDDQYSETSSGLNDNPRPASASRVASSRSASALPRPGTSGS